MGAWAILQSIYSLCIIVVYSQQEPWVLRGSYQYRASNHKAHCILAQEECQKELGYLAVVTSSDDNNFLANISTSPYFGYWKKVDHVASKWTWGDGGSYQYTNWNGGSPPTELAQTECYCNYIASDLTWHYDNCMRTNTPTGNSSGHYFVCQRPQNFCTATACKNGGTCVQNGTNFKCLCANGTTGRLCENVVQYCLSHPCQHGGVCFNKLGHFECECEAGYTGKMCETDIDECHSEPCQNRGNCSDLENGYECMCHNHYNGTHCEHILHVEFGASHGEEPDKVNVAAIVVPIVLGVLFILVVVLVILFLLKRRRVGGRLSRNHGEKTYQAAEHPESAYAREPALQPLNNAPPFYNDVPPTVRGSRAQPDPPQPPANGHYNGQAQFQPTELSNAGPPALKVDVPLLATTSPHSRSASPLDKPALPYLWPPSPLEKTASPLPDSQRSGKPVSRQSTLSSSASSPMTASSPVDKPMLFTRQGSNPKANERSRPVESSSTTADTSVDVPPPPPAKRKKSPRPKSIEDMTERKDRDTSDSDHSSMSTTRPVNAMSGGTNELAIGAGNTSNCITNQPNFNMAKPKLGCVPIAQPKASIIKKPKPYFPSINETEMNPKESGAKSPEMKFQSPIYTGEKSPEMKFPTATYAGEKSPEMKFPSPMYAGLTGGGAGIRKAVI